MDAARIQATRNVKFDGVVNRPKKRPMKSIEIPRGGRKLAPTRARVSFQRRVDPLSPLPAPLQASVPYCQCKGRFLFETTLPPRRENLKRSHDSLYRMPAIYSREILGDKGVYRLARADIYTARRAFPAPNNVSWKGKGKKISPLLNPR